jgi:hypothetical protein
MVHNIKYYPEIPLNILNVILPKKNISVLDILNFSLPGIARKPPNLLQPQTFFSTQNTTAMDLGKIQQTPLPPLSILEQLLQATELQNTQSIVCQHVPGLTGLHFPPWIVTYWAEVARIGTVKILKNTWIWANQYATASSYNWLRTKGQEFGTGVLNKLATITNVGGNH